MRYKRITAMLVIALTLIFCVFEKEVACLDELKGKKIVLIIPRINFNDAELRISKELFSNSGSEVMVACSSMAPVKGMSQGRARPDMLYSDINAADYDAIVFIGGAGSVEYWDDNKAHGIAQAALGAKKVLAAICLAPVTLANAGALSGKKATVWPSEGQRLADKGAIYTGKDVEVDGSIVTANGPASTAAFAQEIIKLLSK